jgi:hypothetical protein
MPQNAQNAIELEVKIEIAICDLKVPSLRQAAAIYRVPRTTLGRRLHGIQRQAVTTPIR